MERLKGKTILIGKEPGAGRLLIAVQGMPKSAALGAPGCVPAGVSRCFPAEGVAHAKLTVNGDGNMLLTNIKPQNVTYVCGAEIVAKRVLPANTVELGRDRFRISLPTVIETAKKLVDSGLAPASAPSHSTSAKFDISHLERVWNDLHDRRREIQARQKRTNLIRSGCGLFTMCAMPCIFVFGPVGYLLTGIGIVGNLYSFIGLKNDDTAEVLEQINEDFQDRYICPNPDCGKFLGNISYRLLKRQYSMHCPYCKSQYLENKL